ncbi:MAG: GntR family transcriptional regulator [Actinomycetes bacterium]|jgi:GntR family transcriptional regulator
MVKPGPTPETVANTLDPELLDRTSFVPLYYQLQEVLKERIESGGWGPGDALPSEPDLARSLGVSRAVVRRALAILEDDRQIQRIRGRGTFVAEPKMDYRAGGLARILESPRESFMGIKVLDRRVVRAERSIRERLGLDDKQEILRLTALMSIRGVPIAISSSFFSRDTVAWLEEATEVGSELDPNIVLADHGVELAHSDVSIETSQCGQFEADCFGIPERAAVFLVLCQEFRTTSRGAVPFEVARVEYRGDRLQFRLDLSSGKESGNLEATMTVDAAT